MSWRYRYTEAGVEFALGKPICPGIPAPNASATVREKIVSEIDRRQGGDVTLRSR
jgi:hypothetical protein